MGNYVIAGVGNYVIENPSDLGNFMIADKRHSEDLVGVQLGAFRCVGQRSHAGDRGSAQ